MRPAVILAALLLLGAAAPGQERPSHPSPAETRAEFEAVCERLTSGYNVYWGTAVVDDLTARLSDPELAPPERAMTAVKLSTHMLRLGRFEEARERILQAVSIAREDGFLERPEVRRTLDYGLGITYALMAENRNCIGLHTAASCILPLTRDGIHREPDLIRRAGDHFLDYLRITPDEAQVRWWLNLTRMLSGEYPEGVPEELRLPAGALSSEEEMPRWIDIAPTLGVNAFDLAGGAVADDIDGDGLIDLVSSTSHPCGPLKAFRNDGRGGFEEVAERWGLDSQLGGLNMIHGDYDGDGMLDLLVLRGAWQGEDGRIRNSLLRNDLKRAAGRFVDVTAAAGLAEPAYPTQAAAWGDYDGDGDLDLYIGNEGTMVGVEPERLAELGGEMFPSQLFRNNGDGTFTDIAASAGVENRRYAKGVGWGDYDEDGDLDLRVSNIGRSRLYRNDGEGRFTDVGEEAGVAGSFAANFATWFLDFDNDGDLDLWTNQYGVRTPVVSASYLGQPSQSGHPVLHRNEGGGRFTDVSAEVGLRRPLLVMGANYGDLDGDGWLDAYLGTGTPAFDALMPNVMYRNDSGRRVLDVTFAGGFGHLQKGHGVAFADLDNDGDQDLFHQLGGFYPYDEYGNALFENPGAGHRWITLRLVGTRANRFGVGARIEVRVREAEASRSIHLLAGSGGSFGGSSLQQEIGLGAAEAIESITVLWPGSGTRQSFAEVAPDRIYRVTEGEEELVPLDLPRLRLGAAGPATKAHRH